MDFDFDIIKDNLANLLQPRRRIAQPRYEDPRQVRGREELREAHERLMRGELIDPDLDAVREVGNIVNHVQLEQIEQQVRSEFIKEQDVKPELDDYDMIDKFSVHVAGVKDKVNWAIVLIIILVGLVNIQYWDNSYSTFFTSLAVIIGVCRQFAVDKREVRVHFELDGFERYVPEQDLRTDVHSMTNIKHKNWKLVWIKQSGDEFTADYFKDRYGQKVNRRFLISYELFVQVFNPANVILGVDKEVILEKIKHQSSRMNSINFDRYVETKHNLFRNTQWFCKCYLDHITSSEESPELSGF